MRLVALLLALVTSMSYRQQRLPLAMSSRPSYQDMLRRAQDAKAGGSAPPARQQQKAAVPSSIAAPAQQRPAPRANADGLPFDDEMYDNLKYAISRLTARIKGDTVLSQDELRKFKDTIDAILVDSADEMDSGPDSLDEDDDDSMKFIDSMKFNDGNDDEDDEGGYDGEVGDTNSVSAMMSAGGRPPPVNQAFSELAGRGSAWNVPGQDEMTTAEFYSAVNKRLQRMKAARKSLGQEYNDSAMRYEESLNQKNNRAVEG